MADENLDMVFHLGDYIYEGNTSKQKQVRSHAGPVAKTLQEYRRRHALYRMDPHLQRMHTLVPWAVTWDDHESWNDMAGAAERHDDELRRRAASYKAYYEHMPLRKHSLPSGPEMLLYRRLQFGRLADFFVLDTRQYRSKQIPGKAFQPLTDAALNSKRTMLGNEQRKWLFDGLLHANESTTWNVLAQQVMMANVDRTAGPDEGYSKDKWPGYEFERRRVLKHLQDHRIQNAVVLTGDIHSNWACNLPADFINAADYEKSSVATEFVGTSITSGGDGVAVPDNHASLLLENPFIKYHNRQRGYVTCELSPEQWVTHFRTLDYVTRPDSRIQTSASFVVEAGRPEVLKA